MADNQNTGPSQSSQAASNLKDTKQALKDLIRSGEDFNDIIKDQVRELGKLLTGYDKVRKSIDGYRSSSLDVKKIQNDIENTIANQFVQQAKVNQLEAKLSKDTPAQLHTANQLLGLLKQKEGLTGQALEDLEDQIDAQMRSLSPLQAEYIARQKSLDLIKLTNEDLDEQLAKEKAVEKGIGVSGAAFSLFSKKLGLGTEVYEKMVSKARELQEANGKISKTKVLGAGIKAAGAGLLENITDPLLAIPLAGAAIGGVVKGLKAAFDYIVGIQDQTVKFARAMNMSTQQARQLKMEFASLNVSNGDLFVNTQKLVESQMEFVDALGVTNVMSSEILSTNIKLKDISGLELETRQGIAETAVITGKSSESVVKSVLAQVEGLKRVTGIQFQNQKILKEASNLGGVLGLQFAKYPEKLTKSLLTVKAMGLELKQLDSMADSFLDFESSISAEFEAQLLTGKEINLNKARELFLNNDLAGAALEINKQVGSSGDFLKMNRIQAESLAKAFGMSRDQMGDMLKRQELLSRLGAKDTDNARQQLQIGLERYKTHKALKEAVGEEAYQNMMNASMQEKIAAFMEKIKQSISDFVESSGIIDKIEGFMDYLSKPENIRAVIVSIRDVFASIVDIVATIAGGVVSLLDFFGAISDAKAESIQGFLEGAGDRVRALGGDLQFAGPGVSNNKAKSETTTNAPATNTTVNQGFTGPQTILIENKMQTNNEVLHRSVTKAEVQNTTTKNDNATNKNVASGGQ
jgi:hypothetical protein